MTVGLIILAAIVIFVLSGIKVVNQYQRGVVLTLGKFSGRARTRASYRFTGHSNDDASLIYARRRLTCRSKRLLLKIT